MLFFWICCHDLPGYVRPRWSRALLAVLALLWLRLRLYLRCSLRRVQLLTALPALPALRALTPRDGSPPCA